MDFIKKKLKTIKKSQKAKQRFIKELGYGKIPTSILVKETNQNDVILNKENRTYASNYAMDRNLKYFYGAMKKGNASLPDKYSEKLALKHFSQKARNCRSGVSCLSIFPQKIGKTLVKFYCPENGVVFDPFCVSGDTLISLPEGDFPIKDLVGKEPYVYCSDGEEIRLRKAYNIRKTRVNAKVIEVLIDNGKSIIVTPNHLFMTTSGEWIAAKDLKPYQSLMPFYRIIQHGRYVVRLRTGRYKRQSKFVFEEITGIKISDKEFSTHHIDRNKLNDSFDNLILMPLSEHAKIHHPKGIAPYCPTLKTRRKIAKATTGKKNPFYGKKHSKQTKEKIGESASGRNFGKKHSKQTKRKMSDTWKKREDRKYISKIQELLMKGDISHKKIAEIAGVHKNTVGNIARNKFSYNHRVVSIREINKRIDVYNMEVEEFHNFVANGVIVHNCGHNSRMQLVHSCNRNYVGFDVSKLFMEYNRKIRKQLLKTQKANLLGNNNCFIKLHEQSSDKTGLPEEYADFTITSPPYWKLEKYGKEKEQLGRTKTYDNFLKRLYHHVKENYRVLKKDSYAVWCVNDFVIDGVYYCFHADLVQLFNQAGFKTHAVYIIDIRSALGIAFIKTIMKTMRFPKQHEYALVFKKE